jgi:hypothetical protein
MPQPTKTQVKSAADLEAEQAAKALAEEGATEQETEAAATKAAEEEVQRIAPELTDEQVEKIAAASGKAAAQETIAEMRRIGAIREEEMAQPPAQVEGGVPAPGAPPPPASATPQQIEIQQEPPKKLSLAERFVGRK